MQYKNIMVPFDGSEPSANAVKVAFKLKGGEEDVRIHVVTVIPGGNIEMGMSDYGTYRSELDKRVEKVKAEMANSIKQYIDGAEDIEIEGITSNAPTEGIIRYAENNDIDLIVMGNRGMGALRGMLGSVSYGVIHQSDVPVMVTK